VDIQRIAKLPDSTMAGSNVVGTTSCREISGEVDLAEHKCTTHSCSAKLPFSKNNFRESKREAFNAHASSCFHLGRHVFM
jgi:ABC-type Fe3+-citrate transport system substrate-binding protein